MEINYDMVKARLDQTTDGKKYGGIVSGLKRSYKQTARLEALKAIIDLNPVVLTDRVLRDLEEHYFKKTSNFKAYSRVFDRKMILSDKHKSGYTDSDHIKKEMVEKFLKEIDAHAPAITKIKREYNSTIQHIDKIFDLIKSVNAETNRFKKGREADPETIQFAIENFPETMV